MQLTAKVMQQVINALKEKGAPQVCPLCKTPKWTMSNGVVFLALQENVPGPLKATGTGVPCAVMSCANCGNTALINIITLGMGHLLEPEKKQSQ